MFVGLQIVEAYFENFEQTEIENFEDMKNNEFGIWTNGNWGLNFVGLKIENYKYFNFGQMENKDFEMNMDIKYLRIENFCGFEDEYLFGIIFLIQINVN